MLVLGLVGLFGLAFGAGPCETECSHEGWPHCGAWLQDSDVAEAAGVYRLPAAAALNLSCAFRSLPKPVPITWLFKLGPPCAWAWLSWWLGLREESGAEWRELHCSSLSATRDCSINAAGEHRTSSNCVLRIAHLNQTGFQSQRPSDPNQLPDRPCRFYQCSAGSREAVSSAPAHVQVFGIPELRGDAGNKPLWVGKPAQLSVTVCSNPTPEVWPLHPSKTAPPLRPSLLPPIDLCHQLNSVSQSVSLPKAEAGAWLAGDVGERGEWGGAG